MIQKGRAEERREDRQCEENIEEEWRETGWGDKREAGQTEEERA